MATLSLTRTHRLLVTRRDPQTRRYETLGDLVQTEQGYSFTYRPGVGRTLPGMSRRDAEYTSTELFPLFRHRVISPRRADHDDVLEGLGLPGEATPFEVLTRSGGRSAVDTLELTPAPDPGPVDLHFLVHGIRHLGPAEQRYIDTLSPGTHLAIEPEPTNPADPRALLVTEDGHRLGYVPHPLLDDVSAIAHGAHELTVVRVNPADMGFHMRLLVRLVGTLPA